MDFPPQISIKGKEYSYVDTQRSGISAIYKSDSMYLRIGGSEKIKKDLLFHKKMEDFGYPVPKLLDEGVFDSWSYFVEESLGDTHFGFLFRDDIEKFRAIQNSTFSTFLDVCLSFAEAQLKTITNIQTWEEFEKAIHVADLCRELPNEEVRIRRRFEQVKENLSVFPFAINHGDLTPFNMYPKGVIDFEDSFMGPVGYDLGALIEHLNWFPIDSKNYEYYRLYEFSSQQKAILTSRLDEVYAKHNLPRLSAHLVDLDFAKGVWFVVHLNHLPKLQEFRYSLIKSLLDS